MKLMMQQQPTIILDLNVLTPPKNGHFDAFEEDLYDLARNIEFKIINTVFQNQLSKDI